MTEVADFYAKASFQGVEFPYSDVSIKGGLRVHEHVYLHKSGAELESLARIPYEFKFTCPFHTTIRTWNDTYPSRLAQLLTLFETEETYDLDVPGCGTFPVKATGWDRSIMARIRSGEVVTLTFKEDSQEPFTATSLLDFAFSALPELLNLLELQLVAIGEEPGLLDQLKSAVGALLAARDQAGLLADYALVQGDSVFYAASVLSSATVFQNPANSGAIQAFEKVWAAAADTKSDSLKKTQPMLVYLTPERMTVPQIATALYGSTLRAPELMRLNYFDDAMNVPVQSLIRYYA